MTPVRSVLAGIAVVTTSCASFDPSGVSTPDARTQNIDCMGQSYGDGEDGAVIVDGAVDLNRESLVPARQCADAVAYNAIDFVDAPSPGVVLDQEPAPGCLAAGDEVLLLQLQASAPSRTGPVGRWEVLEVADIADTTVYFTAQRENSYGAADGEIGPQADQERVLVQRVPNYSNVTITETGILTASAFDCARGGVLFIKAWNRLEVSGAIDLGGRGYAGGPGRSESNGGQGDSYGGDCDGQAGWGYLANLGGGGGGEWEADGTGTLAQAGGGGGGHGGTGTDGDDGDNNLQGGRGGAQYGAPDPFAGLYLGSGGGGGGNDRNGPPGEGGRGGGIITVFTPVTEFVGDGRIAADGDPGESGSNTAGAGGGGSGGTVLVTGMIEADAERVTADGGAGGTGSDGGNGGNGGAGRVFTYFCPRGAMTLR